MNTTSSTGQPPIIGWYCEGTFPALFTDSVTVAKRWMELGSKVVAVIRQADVPAATPAAGDALRLALDAVEAAQPIMKHYTEPNERHQRAIEAVRAAIAQQSQRKKGGEA